MHRQHLAFATIAPQILTPCSASARNGVQVHRTNRLAESDNGRSYRHCGHGADRDHLGSNGIAVAVGDSESICGGNARHDIDGRAGGSRAPSELAVFTVGCADRAQGHVTAIADGGRFRTYGNGRGWTREDLNRSGGDVGFTARNISHRICTRMFRLCIVNNGVGFVGRKSIGARPRIGGAIRTAGQLQCLSGTQRTVVTHTGENITVGGGRLSGSSLHLKRDVACDTGIIGYQKYIPLPVQCIGDVAPFRGLCTITAVNKVSIRIAAPCIRVVRIVIAVGRTMIAVAITRQLRGTHGLYKIMLVRIAGERPPTCEVNVSSPAVAHIDQHITGIIYLHHIPSRGRGIIKTAALRFRKVRSRCSISTRRKSYTIRVVFRTKRICIDAKIIGVLGIAIITNSEK